MGGAISHELQVKANTHGTAALQHFDLPMTAVGPAASCAALNSRIAPYHAVDRNFALCITAFWLTRLPQRVTSVEVREVPCVDGSELARTFFTSHAEVGGLMSYGASLGDALALRTWICSPIARAAASTSLNVASGTGSIGRIDEHGNTNVPWHQLAQQFQSL